MNEKSILLLSILNDELIGTNEKFKKFSYSYEECRGDIIDLIIDSPYDHFLDLLYVFGEDICKEIPYKTLEKVYNFKCNFGDKKIKECILRYSVEDVLDLSLVVAGIKKDLDRYIEILKVEEILLNSGFEKFSISELVDIVKALFSKDYKISPASGDKLKFYKKQ